MSWLSDDICWCANSNHCEHKDCFRHFSNRTETGPCTMANLENTIDCPFYEKEVVIAETFIDRYFNISEMEEGGFDDEIL